jgi:hypothetical protein
VRDSKCERLPKHGKTRILPRRSSAFSQALEKNVQRSFDFEEPDKEAVKRPLNFKQASDHTVSTRFEFSINVI